MSWALLLFNLSLYNGIAVTFSDSGDKRPIFYFFLYYDFEITYFTFMDLLLKSFFD